jgi:hypothetical protein
MNVVESVKGSSGFCPSKNAYIIHVLLDALFGSVVGNQSSVTFTVSESFVFVKLNHDFIVRLSVLVDNVNK